MLWHANAELDALACNSTWCLCTELNLVLSMLFAQLLLYDSKRAVLQEMAASLSEQLTEKDHVIADLAQQVDVLKEEAKKRPEAAVAHVQVQARIQL